MTVSLYNLARHGEISWLSYYFAEFIASQDNSAIDELPGLSAALVSEAEALKRDIRAALFDMIDAAMRGVLSTVPVTSRSE